MSSLLKICPWLLTTLRVKKNKVLFGMTNQPLYSLGVAYRMNLIFCNCSSVFSYCRPLPIVAPSLCHGYRSFCLECTPYVHISNKCIFESLKSQPKVIVFVRSTLILLGISRLPSPLLPLHIVITLITIFYYND